MEMLIRRMEKDLPLPEYKTARAAAVDLYVRESAVVPPHSTFAFHLNLAIQLPPNHFGLMAARSSLFKRGLVLRNGIGIIDEDFAGDEDECRANIYNFTEEPVTVERGDRLVQLIVLPFDRVVWKEVDSLGNTNRGGIGTTGK
ncbi:hypothetical protein A3G63_01000 [Candidatus Kaiserbacteria bacterium RIFCSPLOWO2_12_FULL_52_8]|uniref:dUTP diphosphatase n=1 Tax=Candidatus Kaiserbacteria bacterium RIFCSPHIGHO2_01_FULL_53_31 TaxID=1798481 RepID=A0A1F6CIT5_9BACT|nr:MAG: hypothetical protein A2678_00825 [Candidatus Kaiserbacteria bacterium RIFCSPHIGHO2_01_FULL_53_31]OGG92898.1 MAG: hypothetical protein A3G63_01000 [Candidatus Kaiserbacteria bacterium RIFCSPLOWO2_12_FULL_52_8]